MKVRSSLRVKKRDDCYIARRGKRLYLISRTNPKKKIRQGKKIN